MQELQNKKIALVHDYLLNIGGAERVLRVLHEIFPQAPIYTILYDKKFVNNFLNLGRPDLPRARVYGSFLQKLPRFLKRRYKYFSFLIPSAVESLDLSEYDVVISSSSAFSKGVITRPDTIHICYCHTPTRFLWDWTHEYSREVKGKGYGGLLARLIIHFLRTWDRQAADRVDYFVANSRHVAARIKKYYGREAKVIYPPVSGGRDVGFLTSFSPRQRGAPMDHPCFAGTPRFRPLRSDVSSETMPKQPSNPPESNIPTSAWLSSSNIPTSSYYLIVSQLRPYKRIDVAVEAFKKLGFPLVIIGGGDDKKRLKNLAKGHSNIKFLGRQPDETLAEYYKNCRALIFPGEEDFGMVMAEAMSFGKPVLALGVGGAREIVLEGMTGEFFGEPHPMVLADGLRRLNENYASYSPTVIKKRAEKFSCERFGKELYDFVEKCFKM